MNSFEIIEHPADIGLKVQADDLSGLFSTAARGFYSLLTDIDVVPEAPDGPVHRINLTAGSGEELLFEWLRELVFLFSARFWILTGIAFPRISGSGLEGEGRIFTFDPEIYEPRVEVKAVTYHQYYMRHTSAGYEARIIFDI